MSCDCRFEQEFSLKCHLKLVHGQDPEVSSSQHTGPSQHDPNLVHKSNGLDNSQSEDDVDGPSPAKHPKLSTGTHPFQQLSFDRRHDAAAGSYRR